MEALKAASALYMQEAGKLPLAVQLGLLNLIKSSAAQSVSPILKTTAALQILLGFRASGSTAVSEVASQILAAALESALGVAAEISELWIWLECLPTLQWASGR